MRAGSLGKSDQVTVGYGLRRGLERVRRQGLPEQFLRASQLGRDVHARVLPPLVVQFKRAGERGGAVSHHLPIRQEAQETEHGEPAEQERRVV